MAMPQEFPQGPMPQQPMMPPQMYGPQYPYQAPYGAPPIQMGRPGGGLVLGGFLLAGISYFIDLTYYAEIPYSSPAYKLIGILSTVLLGVGWCLAGVGFWQYFSSGKK